MDDHSVTRAELAALLKDESDLEIVGEAGDGYQAVEMSNILLPDVVVMDVFMPGRNGIEATRDIIAGNPGVRIIGYSMHPESDIVSAMKNAGAAVCISKSDSVDDLIEAIRGDDPAGNPS